MAGIKETKELLVGLNEVTLYLIGLLKDGPQLSDVGAFFAKLQSDPEFKAKIEAAYNGFSLIGEELGDLSVSEGLELAKTQFNYVDDLLAALRKQAPAPAVA